MSWLKFLAACSSQVRLILRLSVVAPSTATRNQLERNFWAGALLAAMQAVLDAVAAVAVTLKAWSAVREGAATR
ncbi:hypothetical protein D3C81_1956140 [compost metagenome]